MFSLEWPWALALLPLPWIVRSLLPPAPQRKDPALRVPFVTDYVDAPATEARSGRGRGWWLALLAWLAMPANVHAPA